MINKLLPAALLVFSLCFYYSASAQNTVQKDTTLALLPNEVWWGGAVNDGSKMPYGKATFGTDLYGLGGNQVTPLLISSAGRWIWSEAPFKFSFSNNTLTLTNLHAPLDYGVSGNSLREAYAFVSKAKFSSSGLWPDSLLVTSPQYNLWIELMYNPNAKDVMAYAHKVLDNHLPPGVLMIDDNWSTGYGSFEFDYRKFPNPLALTDSLHRLGFKVMVWICPFISPDGEAFRELQKKKLLLMDNEGDTTKTWGNTEKPLLIEWWNGYSACLDLSNPDAAKWLDERLASVQKKYGIDGFKLDAGDANFYVTPNLVSYKKIGANDHTFLWAQVGLKYKLNEYRAMWKMGGEPLVQRLADKAHSWADLQVLIPNTIAQQLSGYTFTCPDMIGGGEFTSFLDGATINQDLMVRSAQCQALTTMMQFSAAPWRVLDSAHLAATLKAVATRQQYLPYLISIISEGAKTGVPVIRPLEYEFPHQQLEQVKDQFILGAKYMVAPVITESNTRIIIFPKGKWKYKNEIIKGPLTRSFTVALDELPVFERM